jgi:uncharacterized OB-fold protein
MTSQIQSADQRYFERLAQGVFEIPKCDDCSKFHFYPRVICPHCGSEQLRWVIPTGNGKIYSTTTVRRSEGDYNVCLIQLDEGPRMMSRVDGVSPDQVQIGRKVRAKILTQDAGPLLVFVMRDDNES